MACEKAKASAGITSAGRSPQNHTRGEAAEATHMPEHHGHVMRVATKEPRVFGLSSSQPINPSRIPSVIVSVVISPVTLATASAYTTKSTGSVMPPRVRDRGHPGHDALWGTLGEVPYPFRLLSRAGSVSYCSPAMNFS